MQKIVPHFVNGMKITTKGGTKVSDIINPATGEKIAKLNFADIELIQQAIGGAKSALTFWSIVPAVKRARVLFKFKQLLEENINILAEIITNEHGKTIEDAKGEMIRGIEVVEFACGIPYLLKGSFSENVGTNVDSYTIRQPLGICAGFTPFNFPAMVPMWMFPIAIACGNCFILKPSEKVPSLSVKLAELFVAAGLPAGVLQVLHGDKEVVDVLLASPDIQATSFVGSTAVAKYIYATSAKYGKRVQALGGAKNHCVIMPDADLDNVVSGVKGAAYGAAGQRCMSISVVVAVGDNVADELIARFKETLSTLHIGNGIKAGVEMGPIQSSIQRDKIISLIDLGVSEGAELVVDGRDFEITKNSKGFFLGPSVFDHVTADMSIYQQEIFGPVLCIMRVRELEAAIRVINNHPYGNGAAIYTQNGAAARTFTSNVHAGMVGINVPIPVPMAFYSFGGWKQSIFGDANMYGPEGINFYTKLKTITSRWPDLESTTADNLGAHFTMPVTV